MSAATASGKPALTLDTAPSLLLASHPIVFPSFQSELTIPGPAPVIFSDDPDRSEETLLHQLPLLRHEMARLAWQFSSREYIDLHSAAALASSPREGHFSRPLCSALDHHAKPPVSQDFLSTPKPTDPAAGRNKRTEFFSHNRKYPLTLPVQFRNAIHLALLQQLSCDPDSPLISQAETQLAQAISRSTWLRYISAWNNFSKFLSSQELTPSWPLTLPLLRQYTVWAHESHHLSPSSIEAYLSSLNQLHQLLGFSDLHIRSDFLIKHFLQGASHSLFYNPLPPNQRRTVTFSILKLIGHQIASSHWSLNSQLTVWTTALVAF
jgi:hypothetical protein